MCSVTNLVNKYFRNTSFEIFATPLVIMFIYSRYECSAFHFDDIDSIFIWKFYLNGLRFIIGAVRKFMKFDLNFF